MRISNRTYECILNEQDMVDAMYRGIAVDTIVVDNVDWIIRYNKYNQFFDRDETIHYQLDSDIKLSNEDYIYDWFLPEEYKKIDVLSYLLAKCSTDLQQERVKIEYAEYEKRDLILLLQFLIYFKDKVKANNKIIGVGRGSSVASYILYLIGIHKIDSIKYELDLTEFLK